MPRPSLRTDALGRPIMWALPHVLQGGRWVPANPAAATQRRNQEQRGNPVLGRSA